MKCKAKTKNGKQCKAKPMKNGFCVYHNPDKAVKKKLKQAQISGGKKNKTVSDLDTIEISSIDDIPAITLRVINEVRTGKTDIKMAYAMGYLINVYVKAEELKTDINKVDELEKKLTAKGA